MKNTHKKLKPFDKIIRFLGGFLVSIMVVTIFLKVLNSFFWAAVLGTIINGSVSYYILTKYAQNESLKITAYGAIAGMSFMIVTVTALWLFIDAAFQGLAD